VGVAPNVALSALGEATPPMGAGAVISFLLLS
jgi:hypothetical protein